MSTDMKNLSFGRKTALQMLIFAVFLALGILGFGVWSKCLGVFLIACLAYALLTVSIINFQRARAAFKAGEHNDINCEDRPVCGSCWYRFCNALSTFFFIAFCALSYFGLIQTVKKPDITYSGAILSLIALSAVLSFLTMTARTYFSQASKYLDTAAFAAVCGLINAIAWALTLTTLGFCAEYFKLPRALYYTVLIIGYFNLLLAAEALLRVFFGFFRPRLKNEMVRDYFDSYILQLLLKPSGAARTFSDMLNHQLGFQASGSRFFKLAGALSIPFILLSILLLWLLSSVVMIQSSEQALVLRFGNVTDSVLEPGIHLKAPWPIDEVRVFDVWKIHRIRVGSHRPTESEEGEIYVKDLPILWTNSHGLVTDELLIVAPPADLMEKTKTAHVPASDGEPKAPSVSLAGADVTVEYRITDLRKYILSAADPQSYFREIAMASASKALLRYDIDSLFCHGRIVLPAILKKEIQLCSDRTKLGIKVVNVGLGGVHPPQSVADAFQETVAALQEKETTIQWARQYAVSNMIESTGSMAESDKLLEAIASEERDKRKAGASELLHKASGYVAVTLSEAKAYRWERENLERGKAERFTRERLLYQTAPHAYLTDCYMSVLEAGLAAATKYMFVGNRKNLILRFDFKELAYPAEEPFED